MRANLLLTLRVLKTGACKFKIDQLHIWNLVVIFHIEMVIAKPASVTGLHFFGPKHVSLFIKNK